jgi:tetratricopeptide (TPR) repeat protein
MVRIMGRNDKDADILNLVYEWLRNKHNGNWVMILDNADDKEVFTSYPSAHRQASLGKQIRDFLPQSSNGSLLVTSRSRDAAYHVTCNYKYILTVEPMTESEAMALMQSQFEEVHPESEIKLLAETLGFVPLAISQAAANISRRSLPISSYLDELRKGNESSASLLDESSPQLRRDSGRSNSIVATWKVTFEYVRKAAPSAARLLSLMCFFDRQNIPEALLEGQYGEEVNITSQECQKVWWRQRLRMKRKKTDSLPSKSLPCDFEQDWLILRDFSLIKLHRNRRNFSMHPMVQFTTLRWLVLRRECDAWSQHFTSIMNDNFFDPGLAASKDCEQLIAHAIAAIPYRPADEATRSLQIWAELTYKVASYYEIKIGAFDRAQKLFCSAAEAFEITLGSCASQSLNCNIRLSSMLWVLGRHGDAEKLYRRTLRLQQIFLGLDHPSTLETLDRIGEALVAQGKHTEAETMHVRSLEARLRTLGPVHDDTQRALSARGLYLSNQNRYGEAYDVWRMAYEARVQDDTTMFDEGWVHHLSGMGLGLMLLGKPREAEKYFREAITEHEKKSTPNNEFVASFVRLARALASQDNYAGAEPFFRRAVECHDMQAADDYNLEQLNTMSDFAYCLWKLGRLDQAEIIASRCLAERIENCGMQDRNTFASMWTLASILEKQRRYAEALKLFKVAFEATKELLGDQHGDTTAFRRDYVALREKCGDDTLATGRGSCGNVCELEGDVALTEVGRDPTENDIQSGYQDTGAGAEQDAVKLPDDDQSTSEDTNRVRAVSGTSSLPAAFGKESFVASGEQNKIPILVRPDVVVR